MTGDGEDRGGHEQRGEADEDQAFDGLDKPDMGRRLVSDPLVEVEAVDSCCAGAVEPILM